MIEWRQTREKPENLEPIVVQIEEKKTGEVSYGIGHFMPNFRRPWRIHTFGGAYMTLSDVYEPYYQVIAWAYLDNNVGGEEE